MNSDQPLRLVGPEGEGPFDPVDEAALVEAAGLVQQLADAQAHPIDLTIDLGSDYIATVEFHGMESHPPEANQIDVAGYRSCTNDWCGELVLAEIAQRTGGLCSSCFRGPLGDKLAEVEVRIQGATMVAPVRRPAHKRGKGNRWAANAAEKANLRAMKRLRALFPELFEILRAEERARVGLDPFPIEHVVEAPPGGPTVDETVSFAKLVAALDDAGVDVRGVSGA